VPIERVPEGAFPEYRIEGIIAPQLRACEGRILAHWKDAVWGKRVADGKHNGHFDDELVEALAEMIVQRWQPTPAPGWVTYVPSMRHPTLVPDLARRLAARLGLPFADAIRKVRSNQPQKLQQTPLHQCRNLDGVFAVAEGIPNGPVLLVDDMIDSGWTMTVLAVLLGRAGAGPVFPVALASTTTRE
jgi:ATP-dependent DNA helicase RecQ